MAIQKPLSELSTDELNAKETMAKKALYVWIGLMTIMILAAIANTVMSGFSVFSLMPLVFAGIFVSQYSNWKKIKEELAKRL